MVKIFLDPSIILCNKTPPLKCSLMILKASDLFTRTFLILLEETINVRKTTTKNLIFCFGNLGKITSFRTEDAPLPCLN